MLSALALMAATWGLLGWIDLPDRGQAGFETDGTHYVTRIRPGSPAQLAGLAIGDKITHFDDIATADASALARQPARKPGDRQRLTIERGGEDSQRLLITYEAVPHLERSKIRASLLVSCGFIFFPLWGFLRSPSSASRVLTLMGIGLGLALMEGPSIGDFSVRAFSATVITFFVMFGLASMLRFLLLFPPVSSGRAPWLTGPYTRRLVFLPAFLLWLLFAWRLLFTPPATSLLNVFTQAFAGLVMGAYLLASLYRFLRNYSRTTRLQRRALALNGMLWGTVAGVLPGLVARLVEAFSPGAALPGQDYYFVSLVLIPFSWARSASRSFDSQLPVANGISAD